jgi:hypothetical protein
MALEFPATPSDGQIYEGYSYDSSISAWRKYNPTQKADIFMSSTAPTPASDGDIWFNTSNAITSIYYEDGDSGQWIELLERGDQGPVGDVIANISSTPPASPDSGAVWYDTDDGRVYFYYEDTDSSQWVELFSSFGPTGPAGADGTDGQGVPVGGSSGDILTKSSSADYDTEWSTPDAQRIFKTTLVSVNFNTSASYTKMSCFDTTPEINQTGFSVTSSSITVPETGYYQISWNIRLSGSGGRSNSEVALGINDSVDDSLFAAHSYVRNASGHNISSSNAAGVVYLSENDTVHIYSRRESDITNAFNSTAATGSFNIHKL